MDKVVASAADAVGGHPGRRQPGGRRVRAVRHPERADRRRCTTRGARPGGGLEQLRGRRLGPRRPAGGPADPPDGGVVRRREQGVRPPVPVRRARGGADAAGHAGRAAARRRVAASRRSTPPPASAPRSPRAGCRGATTPTGAVAGLARRSRPRPSRSRGEHDVRARAGDPRRLRAGARLEGRPARQPGVPLSRPATSTRSAPWPAGSPIAEVEELVEPGELDPNEVHLPGVYVQRVVALTPEQAADKRIEKRTVRPVPTSAAPSGGALDGADP